MSELSQRITTLSQEQLADFLQRLAKKKQETAEEPIRPRGHTGPIQLSFSQERLWFLDQLEPGTPHYNMAAAVTLVGELRLALLHQAIHAVVQRHEALRTTFATEREGEPVQVVAPALYLDFPLLDVSTLPEAARQAELDRLVSESILRPFDLGRGPLLHTGLVRAGARDHVLLFCIHHIVTDGWSMTVFMREVAAFYESGATGRPVTLPAPAIQYPDFAVWQRGLLQGPALDRLVSYWRERLDGVPVLELPTDRPRPPVQSRRGANHRFEVPPDLTAALQMHAQTDGGTLFMVLLSAFKTVLCRWSGQDDLAVGTFIANRNRSQIEGLIGFFVNNLPLRTRFAPELTFRELLARVQETTVGAYAHQDLPFEKLLEELQPRRSMSHTPIFQTMLVLQNTPKTRLELPGLTLDRVHLGSEQSNFDLTLWIEEEDRLAVRLEYATDLFESATAARLARHFLGILHSAVADPGRRLWELPILDEDERQQLLAWATPGSDAVTDGLVHHLFEEQVRARPDAAALVVDGQSETYRELAARVHRLAHVLRRLGIGPEETVGVCVDPQVEVVVPLLAILEAGGAFLPLDPAYPADRLELMVEDAGARLVVTQETLAARLPDGVRRVLLDAEAAALAAESDSALEDVAGPENLAYIIYTSGTTGRPKGVPITHRNLFPMMLWGRRCFGLDERTRVLQNLSYGFDFGVFEILTALFSGGSLHFPGGVRGDFVRQAAYIAEHGIDTVHTTPSFFREILAAGAPIGALRIIHLGGEALTRGLVEQIFAAAGEESAVRVFNGYGPTEATVNSSIFEAERPERTGWGESAVLPIGRATAANAVYLLDPWRGPVPMGVPGELCVGGPGVARGYLARPELTAGKFVPDPFGAMPGGRLYRSGDLGRWLPTGDIEFLGRIDQQVKIRGHRVELEEIEAVLRTCPGVREAAVAVRTDGVGGQRLAAYLVLSAGVDVTAGAVRAFAESLLPAYMIPAAVVFLTALPLTASGKMDRRALPEPERSRPELGQVYVAPRTPTEEVVAGIWAEVLGVARVGVHDGFFELGGHSLLATQIVARVRDAMGVELPLHAFFESPRVSDLAKAIEEERHPEVPPVRPVPRDVPLPLSFAQERLWFLERLHPGQTAYYVPRAVRICGALDVARLAQAYGEMIRRHEVLRTSFPEVAGQPVQVIYAPWPFHLPLVDLRSLPVDARERETRLLLRNEGQRRFDLSRDPLIRATALWTGKSEHLLLQTEHHLVHDGWAQGVLLRDLLELYRALGAGRPPELPPLPVQYADFAAWQREWLSGAVLEEQVSFWVRQLAGAPPLLELPTDRPRPAVLGSRGGEHLFDLAPALADELRAFARRQGVTLFMAMLTVFDVLLHRVTGQTDLVLGSGVANRRRPETEGMIGMMVNTLVLRADLAGSPTLHELVQRARTACLAAYAHQDLPFDKLVEALRPERSTSYSPIFQVLYAFNDAPTPEWEMDGLRVEEVPAHNRSAKFDLLVVVSPHAEQRTAFATRARGSGINVALEYNLDLFDGPTTLRLLHGYQALLEAGCADPDRRIGELPLLREGERAQLLVEWNDRGAEFPGLCIHELFAEQARRTPDVVAVELGADRLTYGELDRRANRLARRLRHLGAGPEAPVALAADRSLEMIVGLLAILKSGGYYLPLDPQAPPERQALLLEEAGASVMLSTALAGDWMAEEVGDPGFAVGPDNLAYVMYTSGSTGRPKGVSVPHRAIVRLVRGNDFAELAGEVFLQLAPLAFDASTLEIWGALLNGGRLVVMPAGTPSLEELGSVLRHHGVTTLWLTAGLFHQVVENRLEDLAGLRQLLAGGDVLSVPHVRRVREHFPGLRLINGYGPTEGTTFTCCHTIGAERVHHGPGASVPAGRPIRNTWIYVLNSDRQLQPVGAPGELFVGGDGLARGYLARPDLTAEAFVPDPFGPPGTRCYRTGDRVRWLVDGTVEFLGRLDHQVKIRGFRIEPGEIEAVLLSHPRVRAVVVVAREVVAPGTGAEKRLVAFVAGEPEALDAPSLHLFLEPRLPAWMVPSAFVLLETLPLTPNGKVDRRVLDTLTPEQGSAEAGAKATPRTPVEELLAAAWAEILGCERIGIHENFFELGGHSLLATRVISRVRSIFSIELPLSALFAAPSVAGLAIAVEEVRAASSGRAAAPPIVPVPRDLRTGGIPLSFAQQRLWFLDQLEPESAAYNIPTALRFTGDLDQTALEAALNEVMARHEVLRTTFTLVDGEPVQRIEPHRSRRLPRIDLAGRADAASEVRRLTAEEALRPFDLERGPLVRGALLRLGEREHVALFTMHHIVSDGWSMGVLVREIAALYPAFAAGRPSPLAPLAVQYADFACWQRSWLVGERLAAELAFWRERLAGAPPALELPTDRPRSAIARGRGGVRSLLLPASFSAALGMLGRRAGATLFMTGLAAWKAVLQRCTGQDDLVAGSPIANRNRTETEALIGFFVNTLVLRSDLTGKPTYLDLVDRVRAVTLAAYEHQDLPFERLVEELAPERSLAHSPLFQVMFIVQNSTGGALELPGLTLAPLAVEAKVAKFDLTLSLVETADESLQLTLSFDRALFDETTAERMIGHFRGLLAGAVEEPGRPLQELPLLSDGERHQLTIEWNDTRLGDPGELTLHGLFEAQAERSPKAPALSFRGRTLTYRELDERANRLAHHLRHLGVGPEVIVGVFFERSPEMVISMLAILKAGGAYLPLSPEQPEERLVFLLGEAAAPVLLTQEWLAFRLPTYGGTRILVDSDELREWPKSSLEPSLGATAGSLAYVIYTSGSTGRPKGVAIEHRSAVTLVSWAAEVFPVEDLAGVLASTAIYFDLSVFELFVTLSWGGQVFLVENVFELANLDTGGELTLVNTVPSGIAEVLRLKALPASVRTVNLAGEPLKSPLVRQLYGLGSVLRVFNLYGPSEDTTYSTFAQIDPEDGFPPIGGPVADTQVRLLDRRLFPVPLGAVGELYLGGAGVARGYLAQPGLTADRFVPDPFSGRPGARMYRTGDLARYRTSGALEYLGRIDHQIKLRGFRIELGEIEAVLQRNGQVHEVVVVVRHDREDDPRLAAYVVPEPVEEARGAAGCALGDELRRHLQDRLPSYMIPSAFVLLEALPLTPNGKVDRKALPVPERRRTAAAMAEPRTPMEEVLAGIWSEVLGRERVSMTEDFFSLGGHSLLAVRVLSRIRHTFGIDLQLRALFEEPTIAGLATRIGQAQGQDAGRPEPPPLVPVPRDPAARLPLSFAQQRLWFLQQLEPASPQYNLPSSLRLSGALRVDALAAALHEIVRRHESLRTTFGAVAGAPFQRVHTERVCDLSIVDLEALAPADQECETGTLSRSEVRYSFDLEQGPVLRVRLLRLSPEDYVLLATMHHIVSDGWSMGVLTRELTALYQAACAGAPSPLPGLPIQYADFAAWQRGWLAGDALALELSYWRAQLAGAPPSLELPTDRPRPAVQSLRGAQISFALPAGLSGALAALGQREGATLFMTLLAAFQALLAHSTGELDLSIGSPMAGRDRLEVEGLIGFFVNTLVLRTDLAGDPTFQTLLARARDTVLEAHRHQDVPFEKLVEELKPERDLSRTPLFQVMLILQNASQEAPEIPGLTLRPLRMDSGTSKFDLTLAFAVGPEGLQGGLEYCADLFDEPTILRLLERLRVLCSGVVADPGRRLTELLVLSQTERSQLLTEWNVAGARRREALPVPGPAMPAVHQPPSSELELRLAAIWKELLDLDEIGVHDRLFDRGAHSLLMVQAYAKMRDLVGDRLTLVDLFKYPTIASLVSYLEPSDSRETLQLQRGRERSGSRTAAQGQVSRDIAIVGLRGRFPKARDLGQFWQNLCDGVEAISFFSEEELRARGVSPAVLQDPSYVRAGCILDGLEWFDASFFGYSPREAEIMDPQQRLFLESAWEALEDAGYDPQRYPGAIGVFAGVSMSWYWVNILSDPDLLAVQGTYQAMIGNDKDFLPTRVSYKLNLRGPSVNVQSACSTSLVAVHLACQSLLNGESDMALAGGVSVNPQQGVGYTHSEGGILSPDGHCRAFDAQARGTVVGNGLGVVVLKRLADAIADGDTIRAVIKGSAINNDGSFKVGYTAPSVEGQANVIAEAQAVAGVDPDTITYVETHGTGTEVGDPIEVEALTAAWRQRTDRKGFCAIGSVKTNIGHLDAAAGVTGLVKTVLALQAGKIPPSLHFERPNPKIDLENSPFYVNTRLTDWISEGPRRAGVSSFGLGGTNAHVVLEEAPRREPSDPPRPLQLLVLSTRANLEATTDNLAEALRNHPETPLADVAYTLQVGRAQFDRRRVLVCRDREDALRALETRDPERLLTLVQKPVGRRVVFLFPGGGAQYADMGLELYRQEPVFREEVDRCLEILAPHLGLDLKPYLYPSLAAAAPGGALSRTSTALPALFITEMALAKLWISWGVRPQALIGHSLGEYAAACLAGVMSLKDALALVALRGRLFETLPEGAMLSVPLPELEILPLLGECLSIAAINDAAQCVVSGPVEEIARLERDLTARGLEVHKLHIEVAAHSSLVEPILEEFGAFLRSIRLQVPSIPFVSDVTGTWIRDEEATDPGYWVRQLRHTVRFAVGLDTLLDEPHQVFLEMGPGRILSSFVRRHSRKSAGHEIFTTLRHIKDSISDLEFTFNLLGRLWLLGQEIDWAGFYAGERRHRVPLPTYLFDRQRYWVERRLDAAAGVLSRQRLAKKPEVADWFYAPAWRPAAWPSGEGAGEPGEWLLFADACGVGRELAEALASRGHQVIAVFEGPAFTRLEDDAYVLDPASAADYDALLEDLQRRRGIPRRIVHLWSVTVDDPAAEPSDRVQDRGFYSLLRLAQALLRQNVTDAVQLDVVANGLQRVDGRDVIRPEKATLLGLCQVLPQEYDHFSCRAIDVVLQSGHRRDLARRLLAEISRPAADRLVAFRDRRRWVRSFDPVRIEAPAGVTPVLRERGVYLITGGLGRFGLSYARHLAGRVQARLILSGRSGLPPREEWPEWLETRGDDPVGRKIRRIQELEAWGAEVVVASADVADEAQMRSVVELARERFGALHGVIHAAGIIGPETFRAIPETGARDAEAHFRPKLRGATVLARVLKGLELDFCLMISSISTVLGGLGFAAYSAANLALDAFAQERDAAGGPPWMSVGWDAWAEREDEERGRSAVGTELAGLAMAPDEGLDVFERCLSLLGVPQLVVSTGDLETRRRRWSRDPAGAGMDTPTAAEPLSLHDRPNLPQPYVAPRDEAERAVADLWQKLLGIQQIGIHDNFFELGGDSLRATQLASGLRRTFQLNVPLRAMFDAPSVAGQAEVITRLRAEQTEPSAERKDETSVLIPIERHRKTLLDELEDLELLSEEGLDPLWDGR